MSIFGSEPMTSPKVLRTVEVARELGLQPNALLRLAARAGVTPARKGRHCLWSEEDLVALRRTAESLKPDALDMNS